MTSAEPRLTNEELFATAHGFEETAYTRACHIEVEASRDLCHAVSEETQRRLGVAVLPLGDSVLFIAPGVPHIMFNRVQVVAADAEHALLAVDEAQRLFGEAKLAHYLVQLDARVPSDEVREACQSRGLLPYRRPWVKLVRGTQPPPAVDCDLRVSVASAADATCVAELVCTGFGFPVEVAAFYRAIVGRPGWSVYLAWDGAEPAGVGISFAKAGTCYLAGGVTLPRFRRRAAQRALMQRRIKDALAEGCHTVVTETGLPLPTEENPSYRNMVHMGFRSVGTRSNFGPEGTKW